MQNQDVRRSESTKAEKAEKTIWNYFRRHQSHLKHRKQSQDHCIQSHFGVNQADTILKNFEGTPNVNNAIPPDAYGDVGPEHYFHVVNLSFTIFNKQGAVLIGPLNSSTIWSGMPLSENTGDAIVLYDEQADRWVMSALCMPYFPSAPYYEMIAVSQTSDPTGSWYRWEYQFDNIPDYPKFSVWKDAYFMSCNSFDHGLNFIGAAAIAFDRMAMVAGDPSASMILFTTVELPDIFSLLPVDCDGAFPPGSPPGNFAYLGTDHIGLFEFQPNWLSPAASTFGNLKMISIESFDMNLQGIPQQGSSFKLDPISDRLMCRAQHRSSNGHQSIVMNHTVNAGGRAGIRWYELRRTTGEWAVYQQSTYAPDSNSRWMGSIAMDSTGNIALGYSVSGPSLYPSIRVTGRMKHDPLGVMTIMEKSIAEGGGAQTHPATYYSRWGDYSSMTVDPSTPSLFWYTQEYYPQSADIDWHTRVAAISFANILDIKAVATFQNICPGQSNPLDVEVAGCLDTCHFFWSSIPPGFTSNLRNPIVYPEISTRYIITVSSGNQIKNDTVQVFVTPVPVVNAGNDTTFCKNVSEIDLSGEATNYTLVKWLSSGDGSFSDANSLLTSYFPGAIDRSDSLIDLELIAYPQPPCPIVSDHRLIRIDTCLSIQQVVFPDPNNMIFPNPGNGQFNIVLPPDAIRIEISDMKGNITLSNELKSESGVLPIDFSNKNSGIYIVRIISIRKTICVKFVKN
ncbi:MAG: T9SS type A sorting domain-containing protein [Bacteroidota bacterium]